MASQQSHTPDPSPQSATPRGLMIGWLVILFILVGNLATWWNTTPPEVTLPYTTFLEQVRADNVKKVLIVSDKIEGTFVKALQWPQLAVAAEPTPPQTSVPTGASSAKPSGPSPTSYRTFLATVPVAVGDPGLLALLESHKVIVETASPSSPWFLELLVNWFPMLLLVGFLWWTASQAAKKQTGMFGMGRSKARQYTDSEARVTFADVAGADEAKEELQEEVDFLRHPQKYHALGARIPRGVLLVGPPGTGKTLLARAVAGEAGVPFFSLSASEFVEMFVGVGASRVRSLFEQAKVSAPAIIFIDELDAVGRRRGGGVGMTNDEREQTLNQLLVEMDGFDEHHEVIVLSATNRPDVLDPALLRPGRFDRQVTVELPDRPGREGILHIHTVRLRLAPGVDLSQLARSTTGMSGADLANLCNEAALIAAQHGHDQVTMTDFTEAQDKVVLGKARPVQMDEQARRVIAYHEAGHTLTAWLLSAADPVQKVTIVAHGRALGVTAQLPGEDRYNYSQTYLLARLAVMLGGRTAEEIAIGDITTGAESDLAEASLLARRMVTRWGMGKIGLVTFKVDQQQSFLGYELTQGHDYSETTAARIDQEVAEILKERHEVVRQVLTNARAQLDRLAQTLLREETVDYETLIRVLGPRPVSSGQSLKVC